LADVLLENEKLSVTGAKLEIGAPSLGGNAHITIPLYRF
jgi:hypothetical protein